MAERALPADTETSRAPDDGLPDIGCPPLADGHAVDLGDGDLFVRTTPPLTEDTEPALYVHGLGGSSRNWTDLAALLAGRLHGDAIDLPGFGHSDPPRDGYGQDALTRRLARYLEWRDRGPVHLIANSLGGALALRLAATRPDLVRTLTLISPAMPADLGRLRLNPRRMAMVPAVIFPRGAAIVDARLRSMPPEQVARDVLEMCFADPSRLHPQRLAEATAEVAARRGMAWAGEAYVQALRGLVLSYLVPAGRSLWSLAARVTVPTLVVWGRRDRLVDAGLAERTAAAFPDARLLLLDDVGHTAQMETPHAVARAVLALLDDEAAGRDASAA